MKFLVSFLFLCSTLFSYSQNLIDNQWQFKTGDSLVWKDPVNHSAAWKSIAAGMCWEKQGYPGYDGYAWYRKEVFISSDLRKEVIRNGGFNLNLGAIDDADQIYFNGRLIGETGGLPPNYSSAFDKIRNWNIESKDVVWDGKNLIVVRVFDGVGDGGIMGVNNWLKVRGLETDFTIKAILPTENQIYVNQKVLSLNIKFNNESLSNVAGCVTYRLINDFKDTLVVWSENLSLSGKSSKLVKITKPIPTPGFYQLHVNLKSKIISKSATVEFGVNPEKIVTSSLIPFDFETFWGRAKKELAAVDPQFKMIRKDSLCTDKRDVFLVEMRSLENVLVRGWYARPKASGKFPAILVVQGYSSFNTLAYAYKGDDMAVFVLNIRGHGNSKDNINPGFPGYLQYSIQDREKYIYRGAYMDCLRAVDFLCSREEVDQRYLVVEGGSQGGALSFATAALDNKRIALCIPAVPFLSDFRDYFKLAVWPNDEFVNYVANNPAIGWEKVYETLNYFDISNLAPWIKCPVFMSIGLKDIICPPRINFAAYNRLTSRKEYAVYPESGHGLPGDYMKAKVDWMKGELLKLRY